jgi:RNA polymerase sigma-70 factor (ECF subfamily)
MGWLRQIFAHELAAALRKYSTAARDLDREQHLLVNLDATSSRLEHLIAADQTSPSQHVSREEELVRLAEAIAQMPTDQRRCVEMHHLQGYKIAEIATILGRGEEAVVGLLYRGLKSLRQRLECSIS